MGYPGVRLTNTSIKLTEFNWGVHAWTLQVLQRKFRPDGIFTMMDLAVEASGVGLQVRFPLHESPSVEIHPVKEESDLDYFKAVDILKDGRAFSFIETVRQLKSILPAETLCGAYVAGPFTLAGLLCGANDVAMNVLLEPELIFRVLELATSVTTRYALALENAGADMIMILDPTAVLLSPTQFDEFAGRFVSIVISALKEAAPIYHVCGDTDHILDRMARLNAAGLSLDACMDFAEAAGRVPEDMVLMGNIAPVDTMLFGTPEDVRRSVLDLREKMAGHRNFILSTGCDLPLETPFQNIEAFMAAALEDGQTVSANDHREERD